MLEIVMYLMIMGCILQGFNSLCPTNNSLTPQQSTLLKQFTSASPLSISQQVPLSNTYKNLQILSNYLIQIDQTYNIELNNIQSTTIIQQSLQFNALDDVWIIQKNNVLVLKCNRDWTTVIGCGTMLELHRPFDIQVISKRYLQQQDIINVYNLPLINVCAGTYHIWFVYSTRIGKVIKSVKPIFIAYPPCSC